VHRGEEADLYENLRVLPRAFLSDHAVFLKDNRKIIRKLATEALDLRKAIYVRLPNGMARPQLSGAEAAQVNGESAVITHYADSDVVIEARTPHAKWLCLSDTFDKNWRATVNGRSERVYKANGLYRAVPIPAGLSVIRFHYHPVPFYKGATVSAFTLLMLGIIAWSRRQKSLYIRRQKL
jgi:uncharacterized membrane protein YfhO